MSSFWSAVALFVFTAHVALAADPPTTPATPPAAPGSPAPGEAKPADPKAAESASPFKTLRDKVSYGIGLDMGRGMKRQGIDIDPALVAKGLADALAGAKPQLTNEEVQAAMQEFQKELIAKANEKFKTESEKNRKDGDTFLAENGKKDGVKTTPSGLQYKVLKSGTGKSPKPTDVVTAHYHGTLLDGTVFDSSVERKQPARLPVNRLIPAWQEALPMMKEGDKWVLYVPGKLGYGEDGSEDGGIGPNATLIFELELIAVGAPVANPAAPKPLFKPAPVEEGSK